MQEKTITPYELPDVKNHSFFFVDARINPNIEAKLAPATTHGSYITSSKDADSG